MSDNTKSADLYMPTDADVKFNYASAPAATSPREVAADEFDRWLAAHDAQVRDAALTEAADAARESVAAATMVCCSTHETERRGGNYVAENILAAIRSLQEGDK